MSRLRGGNLGPKFRPQDCPVPEFCLALECLPSPVSSVRAGGPLSGILAGGRGSPSLLGLRESNPPSPAVLSCYRREPWCLVFEGGGLVRGKAHLARPLSLPEPTGKPRCAPQASIPRARPPPTRPARSQQAEKRDTYVIPALAFLKKQSKRSNVSQRDTVGTASAFLAPEGRLHRQRRAGGEEEPQGS